MREGLQPANYLAMAQRVFEKRLLTCEHEELRECDHDSVLTGVRHVLKKHCNVAVAGTPVRLVAESFAIEASRHKGYGLAEWELVTAIWEAIPSGVSLFPGYLPHGDPLVIEYVLPQPTSRGTVVLGPSPQAVTISTGFIHPENFVALHFLDQGE